MKPIITCVACLALLATSGCSEPEEQKGPVGPTGAVKLGLATPPADDFDVVAVRFDVTPHAGGDVQSRTVPLEAEGLPAAVSADFAGQPFADWFTVLNVGAYTVQATPLTAAGEPSRQCTAPSEDVAVFAEVTTEVLLVSDCTGEGSGGLDTSVVFNSGPFINELFFRDSKFICSSDQAVMTVLASDPDGDELSYTWSVVDLPEGADDTSYCLIAQGNRASMSAIVGGRYELLVEVSDGRTATRLRFPIYVTPGAQQAEFVPGDVDDPEREPDRVPDRQPARPGCVGSPDCPGEAATPVVPNAPAVFAGRCDCGGLDIDPNFAFDPENEWPEEPPAGQPEEAPMCPPDLDVVVAPGVDNNNDGHDDFVALVPVDAQCITETRYCVEQNGTFVEVIGGPMLHPQLPIPLAATSLGCEAVPADDICPTLSLGRQAQDCEAIPAEVDCRSITVCPERGAWADPADPSVHDDFDAVDVEDALAHGEHEPLDPAQLVGVPPCSWDGVMENTATSVPLVPENEGGALDGQACDEDEDCLHGNCQLGICEAFENPYLVEVERGSDKWNVAMKGGIAGGSVRTLGMFHHSLEFDLITQSLAELSVTLFDQKTTLLRIDADNTVSECDYSVSYDAEVVGDSIDFDGLLRTGNDVNFVDAEVGQVNEAGDPQAVALCQQRLDILRAAEKATNEQLHEALVAYIFFNLAGPVGGNIDSQAAAQAIIDTYVNNAVPTYVAARDSFLAAQAAATDHAFEARIIDQSTQIQLSKPANTNLPIGPFTVGVEANAVGKLTLSADVASTTDNEADCEGHVCMQARTRANITPRAAVGGYAFFYVGISLGKFAGVKAGIQGELDFADFQLPIVTEFGLDRVIEPLAPPVPEGDLALLLTDLDTVIEPSAAIYSAPYSYGARLVGYFLGGRIKAVVKAWLLFISSSWSKTIVKWDGKHREWAVGEPGGGDALSAFTASLPVGGLPDFVTLPVLELQAPAFPLPALTVNTLLVDELGRGHREDQIGTAWDNTPQGRCFVPIP